MHDPDIVPAGRPGCPHLMMAVWPEDHNGDQAHVVFWRTPLGIVIKGIVANAEVRGRQIIQWLARKGLALRVVEVLPVAAGFWNRMFQERLIEAWIPSDGFPSPLERCSIPFAAAA